MQGIERVNFHELNERVELLLGVLILVPLSSDSDTHLARNIPDAASPDLSVQKGVNAHFLSNKSQTLSELLFEVADAWSCNNGRSTYPGFHLFNGESPDVLDRSRGSLLELNALEALVHVQRVVAARWLHLSLFSHDQLIIY